MFFFRVCCRGGGIPPPFRQKFDNRFESDQMDTGFRILLFFTVFRELGDGQSRGRVEECGSFFDFSRLPAALRALLCLRSPREAPRGEKVEIFMKNPFFQNHSLDSFWTFLGTLGGFFRCLWGFFGFRELVQRYGRLRSIARGPAGAHQP